MDQAVGLAGRQMGPGAGRPFEPSHAKPSRRIDSLGAGLVPVANPTPAASTTTTTAASTSDEKTMGMVAHLLLIFTWWLGPLILFLVKKEQAGFAKDQAREALNFGITLTLVYIAAWVLTLVTFGVLFFLPFLVLVAGLVFGILGCIAANKGESYRYPVSLRLVK